MKKIFVICTLLLLFTGCAKEEAGSTSCTMYNKDVVNGYELSSTYVINHKNGLVESVETVETVSSEDEEILDTMETYLNDTYKALDESYGGYTYEVKNENGKVTSRVKIDYNKMDIDSYVTDQPTIKDYVEDSKLTLEGVKLMYESMGATCEEK